MSICLSGLPSDRLPGTGLWVHLLTFQQFLFQISPFEIRQAYLKKIFTVVLATGRHIAIRRLITRVTNH